MITCKEYFGRFPEHYTKEFKYAKNTNWLVFFRSKKNGVISEEAFSTPESAFLIKVGDTIQSYLQRPDECFCLDCWKKRRKQKNKVPSTDMAYYSEVFPKRNPKDGSQLIHEFVVSK